MPSPFSTRASRYSLALALGVLVVFALHLRAWTFLCDDAYISFRYAENLAESGLPVYNLDPLERVEGYTNPAWVFLLGLFAWLGFAPPSVAPVLCALAAGASLLLAVGCQRQLFALAGREPREAELYIAPFLLALMPEFVVWGSGGLEGAATACAGLSACLLAMRGRWRGAGVAAALCLLLRADAAFWLAPPIAIFALRHLRAPVESATPRWRPLAESAAVVLLLVGGHLLWRHSFYGEWLPNTWKVKQFGVDLRNTWGRDYLAAWAVDGGLMALAPFVLLVRGWTAPWLAAALGSLFWGWWVGGDFMAYGRFLLPATIFGLLYAAASLSVLREWLGERPGAEKLPVVVATIGALALTWRIPERIERDHREAWIDRKWESVQSMHEFAAVRVAAGRAFAAQRDPSTRVSVGAAGAMPYASRMFTFDSYGLVDPAVVDDPRSRLTKGARPGHVVYAPLDYIKGREPDLMCHIGHAGESRPSRSTARRRAGSGWDWACVETGDIEDRRAPGGVWKSRYYCCLAPSSTGASRP